MYNCNNYINYINNYIYMSSNWKKIGKNAGGEMQYNRHIRTATHNEQWEET